jgi:hypothetical protein
MLRYLAAIMEKRVGVHTQGNKIKAAPKLGGRSEEAIVFDFSAMQVLQPLQERALLQPPQPRVWSASGSRNPGQLWPMTRPRSSDEG